MRNVRPKVAIGVAAATALLVAGGAMALDSRSDSVGGCIRVSEGDTPQAVRLLFGQDPMVTPEAEGVELHTWNGGWVRFENGAATAWHSLVYGEPKICDD